MTQSAIASMANVTEQNSVASNSPFGSFLPTRQAIFAKTIKVLAGYRKTCSSHSSSGQLILPETLKLLPLYSLAMTKSKLFRDLGMNTSTALTTDNKVALLRWIKSLDPLTLTTFLYPKLFQLSNNVADSESDFYEESIDGEAALPLYRSLPVTSLSHPLLDFGQVYVLHNGVSLILWIGQQASPAILQDLFSVSSLDQVPSSNSFNPTSLSSMETILARRLVKLQSQLEQKHQRPLPLTLIRHNLDVMVEVPEFVHALIHDKSPLGTDYVDFLCVMHNQIQSYLANL